MDARAGFVAVAPIRRSTASPGSRGPPAGVVRAVELLETPGGKAIHAACVAAELGAEASGDHSRRRPQRRSAPRAARRRAGRGRSRPGRRARPAGPTRWSAPTGGDLVEVHEPGGVAERGRVRALVSRAGRARRPRPAWSRSAAACPPGAPTDLHARLVAAARELGAFTILDCSTPAALAAGALRGSGPGRPEPRRGGRAARGRARAPARGREARARSWRRSGSAEPPRSGSASARRAASSPSAAGSLRLERAGAGADREHGRLRRCPRRRASPPA